MDINVMMTPALHMFYYLIPAIILLSFFKSPWFKGKFGEFTINLMARRHLAAERYHLVKNVTLPTDDGGTTQIDHIIVSQYGIFVVETKNMKGWIFGNAKQSIWTQKIYKKSFKFQNPLFQNYRHVKTLEQALGFASDKFFSVVVFIGEASFKTEMPDNVTAGKGYIRFIQSKQDIILSDAEVHAALASIESGRLVESFKTDRAHIAHLKQKHAVATPPQPTTTDKLSCPKCGSTMVIRTIKKGQKAGEEFWGCSQYPRCRSMINIEG